MERSRGERVKNRTPRQLRQCVGLLFGVACLQPSAPMLQAQTDLTQASLEDLMNVQVTSVSKKEQQLSKTGAAVFVISQEDIRRSGANEIPDLLRMVPGVDVARINSHTFAISIRGFNDNYPGKVLVLIDGRSVYTPQFSGVYWDQQDMPLEDIDRIEVIRGPGGTIWGANAVNGIINIITKSSKETRGGLLAVGTSNHRIADGTMQYGGGAGQRGSYRIFGRYLADDGAPSLGGGSNLDRWHGVHGGFRSDWDLSKQDSLTVQGDLFGALEGATVTSLDMNHLPDAVTYNDRESVATGNLLSRWTHTFAGGSEATVQAYYDYVRRPDEGNVAEEHTGDLDFEYHFHPTARQDVVTGGGYRVTDQRFTGSSNMTIGTGQRLDNLVNAFVQDEIALTQKLDLTAGVKVERNDFTGFEYQPSAQVVFSPTRRQNFWVSAARAIEQPSWFSTQTRLNMFTFPLDDGGFALVQTIGSETGKAISVLDFEAGYRTELTKRFSMDVALFRSYYHQVQDLVPGAPYFTDVPGPPHLVLPYHIQNQARETTYGAELFVRFRLNRHWELDPGYSFLQARKVDLSGESVIPAGEEPGDSPKHEYQIRSMLNLPHHMEWDTSAYYVSSLQIGPVPSYTRVDTRVGWRAGESVEFSVGAQNLLAPRHLEYLDTNQIVPTFVERSLFGKVTWRF